MKIEINGYTIDLSKIIMIGPFCKFAGENYCYIYTQYDDFHIDLGETDVAATKNYNELVAKFLEI